MKMTRIIGLLAALAAFTVAAPSVGAPKEGKAEKGQERSAAAKLNKLTKRVCQAERAESGRDAFRAQYGDGEKGQHAMRNCKRANRGEVRNASKECKAERQADADAFAEQYGTNANKRNAHGKCVVSKVNGDDAEDTENGEDTGETTA